MPIRQPSTQEQVYDFWSRSVAGERVPRNEEDPQCGFYRMRKVRGGPWVAVEIWLEQQIDDETGELVADEKLRAIQNGEPVNPAFIWTYCRPIRAEEYDALTGARSDMEATMKATMVAVDLGALPPIMP